MSVSFDSQSLESLKQFKAFFDFLSNPKEYKDLLDRTELLLKKMEEVNGVYNTLQKVEEYSKQVKVRANEAQVDLDKRYDVLEKKEKDSDARLASREKALEEKEQVFVSISKKLTEWEKSLADKDVSLNAKQGSLDKVSKDLNEKAEELKVLEKKLQEKERAFKALSE